jgi:hypothetical protein
MKVLARSLVAIVLLVGAGIGLSSWLSSKHSQNQTPALTQSPLPSGTNSPTNHYPVTAETDLPASSLKHPKPIPRIEESDQNVEEMLSELIGKDRFESIFNLKNIIRRFVVIVENARKFRQISQEFSPFIPLERGFIVQGKSGEQSIDPRNFKRYLPYVELARTLDSEGLVNIYVHFYPLFQSAYEDLGSRGYFNDRLIEAIDTLLGAPEIKKSISVTPIGVHKVYKYTDDQLEELPAAQKILIRMGNENSSIVQAKLRELRKLLAHLDKNNKG